MREGQENCPLPSARVHRIIRPSLEITVLTFAQARDLFGFSSRTVACSPGETARELVLRLAPAAELTHLRVALDCEYVSWETALGSARELAIIPPVSGG